MQETLIQTAQSFLSHNFPLIFFGGFALLFLILVIIKPVRNFVYLLIGFSSLALNFEYKKHLYTKIKTDMVDLIFPEGTRFTIYKVVILSLKYLVPLSLSLLGYFFITLGIFLRKKKPKI